MTVPLHCRSLSRGASCWVSLAGGVQSWGLAAPAAAGAVLATCTRGLSHTGLLYTDLESLVNTTVLFIII